MLASSMTFRRADIDDGVEVARLATELGYPVETGEMRARLTKLLPDPAHYVAVASGGNGSLRGWIHAELRLSLEGGARAEIMGLVVDSSFRRIGIGRALVGLAESWASDHGLKKITVRSNVVRTGSHAFYEARGYSHEKTQNVYAKALPTQN